MEGGMSLTIRSAIAIPLVASVLIVSPGWSQPGTAQPPERNTAAFREVVQLHAAELAQLASPAEAGIWLVQDTAGHRISSGVLAKFPASIASENYGQVVPGAAGLEAVGFGLARTPVVGGAGPFRVAYVTIAKAPPARAPSH
jgi:hypothetical protein